MEITRITKNNLEAFQELLPEDLSLWEDKMAFGAISEENEGVAAMLLTPYDRELIFIDWLYTHPDRRERGAATELLETILAFLQGKAVKEVCATFPDGDGILTFFLQDHGFLVGEVSDVYRIPIEDLMYTRETEKLLAKVKGPVRVWSLKDGEVYEDLCDMLEGRGIQRSSVREASKDYSLVEVDEEGRVTGCILVKEGPDDELEIMYFLNDEEQKNGAIELLAGFYRVVEKHGLSDRTLLFTDPAGHSIGLVETLTGGDREDFRVTGLMRGVCVL